MHKIWADLQKQADNSYDLFAVFRETFDANHKIWTRFSAIANYKIWASLQATQSANYKIYTNDQFIISYTSMN